MNSRQRRKQRRAMGVTPPYQCLWCEKELPTFDAPCDCPPERQRRIRKPFRAFTLVEAVVEAQKRGKTFTVNFRPASGLEELAALFEPTAIKKPEPIG